MLPGNGIVGAAVSCSVSVAPAASAAAVVITLKVEPGGYVSEMARLVSGEAGLSPSRCQACACTSGLCDASRLGS
ncbi:Uncharacterised protein [Mycobacterium tuberculosis]|uniref:Uncharacterized protein n=1 Tax=Mycobacterium tuberculosis TaxID=1773 RepID=A0A655AHE5_MYCTX|nr:Uncharacterised protein [Mycobacterium tuberculosis]CKS91030.1 Uncharacterised protein [Mycobacterium tuberculosis]